MAGVFRRPFFRWLPRASPIATLTAAGFAAQNLTAPLVTNTQAFPAAAVTLGSDPLLSWAPPAQTDPTIVQLPAGFFENSVSSWTNLSGNGRANGPRAFADDEDVVLLRYNGIRSNNSDVQFTGGRHLRLIGAHHRGRIYFSQTVGSVYLEGVIVDLTSAPNKDALWFAGKTGSTPDVCIQNCFVTGVQGTNAGTHSECVQLIGPVGQFRVDKLTGDSNYQGLFLRPEFGVVSADIRRCNLTFNALGTPDGNTYLYWLRDVSGSPTPLYPINLSECYAEDNADVPSQAAAWPPPGAASQGEPSAGEYSGVVDGSGNMSWPVGSQITGQIALGNPAGGDFVAAANVGVGYTAATEFQDSDIIQPSLVSDAEVFYAVTVTPGAVSLTAPLTSDGDSFYAPTVTPGLRQLTSPLLTDGDTFPASTVTAGAVALTSPLVTDADTIYALTVTASYQITAPKHTSAQSFPAANIVPPPQALTSPFVTDADTLHAATLTAGAVTLTSSLLSDADAFYAVVVTAGAASLVAPLVSDADSFHAASVTAGQVALTAPKHTNAQTLYPLTASASYQITAPLTADGDTFHASTVTAGAVALISPLLSDGDAIYTATASVGGTSIIATLVSDGDTFPAATVTAGAATLTSATVVDVDAFYAPTVTPALWQITAPIVSDGETFYALTASASYQITAPLTADGDTFYSASVAPGAVSLTAPLTSDADTIHNASLTSGALDLAAQTVVDGDTFPSGTVTAGAVALTSPLLTDGDVFYAGTVTGLYQLTATAVSDGDTFPAASVTPGLVQLTVGALTDGEMIYSGSVTTGSSDLAAQTVVDIDSFFAALVAPGAVGIVVPKHTSAQTLYPPSATASYQLTAPRVSDGDTFYAGTISASIALTAPRAQSVQVFPVATIAAGAVSLTAPKIADGEVFYGPALLPPGEALTAESVTNTQAFYSLALALGAVTLTPPLLSGGEVIYPATVDPGDVSLLASLHSNVDIFYGAETIGGGLLLAASLFINAPFTVYQHKITGLLITDTQSYSMVIRDMLFDAVEDMPFFAFYTRKKAKMVQVQPDQLPYLGVYIVGETMLPDGDANVGHVRFSHTLRLGFSVIAANSDMVEGEAYLDAAFWKIMNGLWRDQYLMNRLYTNNPDNVRIEGLTSASRRHVWGAPGGVNELPVGELQFEVACFYRAEYAPIITDELERITTITGFPEGGDEDAQLQIQQVTAVYDFKVFGLTSGVLTQTSVALTWDDAAGVGYEDFVAQYRLSPSGTWFTFAHAPSPLSTVTITGLVGNTIYDFRVAGITAEGLSAFSDVVTVVTLP